MKQNSGVTLYQKAKRFIPGGTQLLSKRPEMFLPDAWPAYYSRCKGTHVWDLDNNEYIDMTISGVGACVLGYADPDVDAAVGSAINAGNMCTLNSPEEVELAEFLCNLHPWAGMVRYARTGGESMAVAVRIARAYSGKDKVLFCGYHGWHDWYLSANLAESSALDGNLLPGLEPTGVPRGLQGTVFPFIYNDIDNFKLLFDKHKNDLACVVMEPVRSYWPLQGFLETIRDLTKRHSVPLIFDEVTSGLRMTSGGIHLKLNVEPDICVLAKALGNGYPMAAILGRTHIMNAAQKSFISSTYWTDRIGPSAALATLRKHSACDVSSHLIEMGTLVQNGWKEMGKRHGLDICVTGIPPLSHWKIQHPESQLIHTILVHKMLDHGFLTSKSFYANYSHNKDDVINYLAALDLSFKDIVGYIKEGQINNYPHGAIAHTAFSRLT